MPKRPGKPPKPAKATKLKAAARAPAKVGRPSSYAPAIAARICERMASGETLSDICRSEGMPHRVTVFRWENAHDEFRNDLARAREAQAHYWADELLAIADDARNDFMERVKQDGSVEAAFNAEHVQRSKLRADTRKWLLAKALPRIYGDRPAGDPGTAENPFVVLMREMKDRALPIAKDPIDSTAEDIEE